MRRTSRATQAWHSPGSVIDTTYEWLDHHARTAGSSTPAPAAGSVPGEQIEPVLSVRPPHALDLRAPDAAAAHGEHVWLVHPWNLGALPAGLDADTRVICIFISDFHDRWPWSERRWQFVGQRMTALGPHHWYGSAAAISAALAGARSVRSLADPHVDRWLAGLARCDAAPALFPEVRRRRDSFSQWWTDVTKHPLAWTLPGE